MKMIYNFRRRKTAPNLTPTEHTEQVALFAWRDLFVHVHPELETMYAIPNGGHRHKLTAIKLKREGVTAGMPDIHLPVPRGRYGSLYIELKRQKGGSVSAAQKEKIALLRQFGNKVEVCKGKDAAIEVIISYLKS